MNQKPEPILCENCGGEIDRVSEEAVYVARLNGFKHRHSAACFSGLQARIAALQMRVGELETRLTEERRYYEALLDDIEGGTAASPAEVVDESWRPIGGEPPTGRFEMKVLCAPAPYRNGGYYAIYKVASGTFMGYWMDGVAAEWRPVTKYEPPDGTWVQVGDPRGSITKAVRRGDKWIDADGLPFTYAPDATPYYRPLPTIEAGGAGVAIDGFAAEERTR